MAARREDHHEYDRLAVDHVLGELDPVDQARFRDHLVSCDACRARVDELRGIARDLQAAARTQASSVLTRTPARARRAAAQPEPRRWMRLAVAAMVGVVIGGLAFWNLQLRYTNEVLDAATSTNRQALATLVEGDLLAADFAEGVRGLVAADATHVAFDLTGLPTLGIGEFVVLWSTDAQGERSALVTVSSVSIADGRLVLVVRRPPDGAALTVEVGPFDGPQRRTVVAVDVEPVDPVAT